MKSILSQIAMETQTVTVDGRRLRLTTFELLCMVVRQHLAQGDLRVFRQYEKILDKLGLDGSTVEGGFLVVREPIPADDEAAKKKWEEDVAKRQRELKERVRDWVDEMAEQARKRASGEKD